jgi:hypothetical protein
MRKIAIQSFEIAYYSSFLPIKYIKSTMAVQGEEVYVPRTDILVSGFYTLAVVFVVKLAVSLQRRAQEMHFNTMITGKWVQIPKPTETEPNVSEWRPGQNYPRGSIVTIDSSKKT